MHATVRQLAELVTGTVQGDGDLVIRAARPIREAEPGDITFVEDTKHAARLPTCRATAVVAPCSIPLNGKVLIRVADPLAAFVTIVRHLHGKTEPPPHGIDPRSVVHATAQVGAEVSIYPYAVVGEDSVIGPRCCLHAGVVLGRRCRLAADVTLYPNAVLYDDTIIGARVVIHANAVVGADGFGYRFREGRHVKVPQLGHVEIGDDVEIGAGTTIDRGTFQATRIGAGTKIDNLVQVGHNCQIGRHNLLVSHVATGGSSSTGDHVVIAGQAGVVEHVRIGEGCVVGAKSGVTKDVPSGQRMLGMPARPESAQRRVWVTLEKLPEIRRDVRRIKRHLGLSDEG